MLTSNGYRLDESRVGPLEPVPDAIRDDRDALWHRLRRDGYLFLRGALDPERVWAFRRHTRPGENGVGTATQAHYDLVYLREGTDRVLSAWIPLGDCPTSLGGLTYLQGSHHRVLAEEQAGGVRRTGWITADLPRLAERYDTRWLVTDYAAGDLVVHSYLIHAALDNVDPIGTMRLSTDIRYQRSDLPIDWRWQHDWHDHDGP